MECRHMRCHQCEDESSTIARLTRERETWERSAALSSAECARLTRERDEARAELDKREQTFSDWLDRAKADERARVVAIVEREGEGEARACEMHARALTDRGRVPVRRMHEAAAGVARTVVHRVKVAIEAGERDK